jgi:anaerobic magnesium-protoporphyrin IX monomethyl ester cyclase
MCVPNVYPYQITMDKHSNFTIKELNNLSTPKQGSMKICICTTPIRPTPTSFPPFGSMAIIQSLKEVGEEPFFYNIDYFRFNHAEIIEYFSENKFDIVGISAVVSTAYTYTKYLSDLIKEVSPKTTIIVGGNLGASAEIILRKCSVDLCVIGDGEIIINNLIHLIANKPFNYEKLSRTKGICFLDENNKFIFTGYGDKPSKISIKSPDYSILEHDGSIDHYISDEVDSYAFSYGRTLEKGKKLASVITTKGCVARCTFCHRFEKGYRARPVEQVIEHVKYLINNYNVGVISIADENFGSDKKLAWQIATELGKLNIVWKVAGVRTRTVTKESLQHWKDNGCYMVLYGIESGSEKILGVMEKNASVEENVNALKWTGEVGLLTIIQLVLALPGENDKTIYETIEFLKKVSPYVILWAKESASDQISINYAQALPGTPLYEYAREHGLIENSINGEEKYLIKISDTDAYNEDHFINTSDLPLLKVLMWRTVILTHLDFHHYNQKSKSNHKLSLWQVVSYYTGIIAVRISYKIRNKTREKKSDIINNDIATSGYFNIYKGLKFSVLLCNPITKNFLRPLIGFYVFSKFLKTPKKALGLIIEYINWKFKFNNTLESEQTSQGRTLRKTVSIAPSTTNISVENDQMIPLRQGR